MSWARIFHHSFHTFHCCYWQFQCFNAQLLCLTILGITSIQLKSGVDISVYWNISWTVMYLLLFGVEDHFVTKFMEHLLSLSLDILFKIDAGKSGRSVFISSSLKFPLLYQPNFENKHTSSKKDIFWKFDKTYIMKKMLCAYWWILIEFCRWVHPQ